MEIGLQEIGGKPEIDVRFSNSPGWKMALIGKRYNEVPVMGPACLWCAKGKGGNLFTHGSGFWCIRQAWGLTIAEGKGWREQAWHSSFREPPCTLATVLIKRYSIPLRNLAVVRTVNRVEADSFSAVCCAGLRGCRGRGL